MGAQIPDRMQSEEYKQDDGSGDTTQDVAQKNKSGKPKRKDGKDTMKRCKLHF